MPERHEQGVVGLDRECRDLLALLHQPELGRVQVAAAGLAAQMELLGERHGEAERQVPLVVGAGPEQALLAGQLGREGGIREGGRLDHACPGLLHLLARHDQGGITRQRGVHRLAPGEPERVRLRLGQRGAGWRAQREQQGEPARVRAAARRTRAQG